jgi:hypothetical protein
MNKLGFILLLIFFMSLNNAQSHAAPLLNLITGTTAEISVFRSDAPTQYTQHSFSLVTNGSELNPNHVNFRYDGSSFSVACNGNWNSFGSAAGSETRNQISCRVDSSNPAAPLSQVFVSLILFDQNVYNHPYANRPDLELDPQLKDTSSATPFCLSESLIAQAEFCKWEQQNLNDPTLMNYGVPLNAWVVFGKTTVTDMAMSYVVSQSLPYPFNEGDQVCVTDLNHDGVVDTSEMTQCISTAEGYLCPYNTTLCIDNPPNGYLCPINSNYQCMTYAGQLRCSSNPCYEFHESTSVVSTDTTQGANDKEDDGTIDGNGNCLGQIYIFSGKDSRCRPDGIETGYFDCCGDSDVWFDLAGEPFNPFLPPAGSLIASRIFNCKGDEKQLIAKKQKGLCHYVGSYCSAEIFNLCIQRKKTYCCYNSKLGRILQEQGRALLKNFGMSGSWGSPKNPNCRGFTPEEFQMLDFSKIDLSEWYGDIQVHTQQQISNTIQNKINDAYDNVQ